MNRQLRLIRHFILLVSASFVSCQALHTISANANDGSSADTFWTRFALPYQNAINVLAFNALKPLADAPVPVRATDAHQLIQNSKASFQNFYNTLEPMRAASEELRVQQDKHVINRTLELQLLESDLLETEYKLDNATTELNEKKTLLADAQTQLARELSSLEDAKRLLRSKEDELHDAKNCIWRSRRSPRVRRFGGFIKSIGRGISHVANQVAGGTSHVVSQVARGTDHVVSQAGTALNHVGNQIAQGTVHVGGQLEDGSKKLVGHVRDLVNAPCPLWAGVDQARDAVRSAEANVASQRQRVNNAQSNVSLVQTKVDQLQQTKTQQKQQKNALANQIADMRSKLVTLGTLSVKVKEVVLYLASLFDVGQTLQNVVRKMVDMAELLEPLQEISTLVGSFSGQNTTSLLQATESIRQSMLVLKDKLPLYPLLDFVV